MILAWATRAILRMMELGGYKQGEKAPYISLLPLLLHDFLYCYEQLQYLCKQLITIVTCAHARRPRCTHRIYNLPSTTNASSVTSTSISDSASLAHAGRQLEAQVEFDVLAI